MFDEDRSKDLVQSSGKELAAAAGAAAAKAEIQAGYLVAMQIGRDIDEARQTIMRLCDDSEFAEVAIKPRPLPGGGIWNDLTIRGIESITQSLKHIRTVTRAIYEDEMSAVYSTTTTDLLTNQTYSKEFRVDKTVWRSGPLTDGHLRDMRIPLEERINQDGKKTYRVMATEDEMFAKINSQESRIIRNNGRRICPAGLLAEAKERILQTKQAKAKQDPEAYRKNLTDAFQSLGISVAMLKKYFGKSLVELTPEELGDARGIYRAIRDRETTWTEYLSACEQDTEHGTIDMDALSPQKPPEKPKGKGGRPKGSKNKPKDASQNVQDSPNAGAETSESMNLSQSKQPVSSEPEHPIDDKPLTQMNMEQAILDVRIRELDDKLCELIDVEYGIKGVEGAKAVRSIIATYVSAEGRDFWKMTADQLEEAYSYIETRRGFEADLRGEGLWLPR